MRYLAQLVSEAALAEPPKIRGMIDDKTIRRLLSWRGSGRRRVLTFDLIGDVTLQRLVTSKDLVAFAPSPVDLPLSVVLPPAFLCPRCGLEMLSDEFWEHYNVFHARRVNWLNAEDWKVMGMRGAYVAPPEQT